LCWKAETIKKQGFTLTISGGRSLGIEGAKLEVEEETKKTQLQGTKRSTMKTIKSLGTALLLATSAVVGVTGCAGDRYTRSTGENIDDTATSSRVKDMLAKDGVYKYPDVKVTTFKGTAQLSGFVDTRDQKNRAAELAKNAAGVREVVNNITVKQ